MSIETKTKLHNSIQWFVENASIIKQLFTEDVDVTVTDRQQVLEQLLSKEINVESSKGRILNSDEPMMEVMRTNKRKVMYIPKEYYGNPFTAVMVPIQDKNGEVIGGIAISKSTNKQTKLMEVAEQFVSSSEEISASTNELATSATNFTTYMNELSAAQNEMNKQVENTSKILDLINTVAKNTRILGFNAGIEAARSGEYGRGFSVVAKEITKLADQSANSVNEIRQLITQLNEKVEQVASIVVDTVSISTNQTTAIEEISQTIQHLTDVAANIEDLAREL